MALTVLTSEVKDTIRHSIGLVESRKFADKRGLKLNLACGDTLKKNWINIDMYNKSADLPLDLRKDFPFKTGSVAEIYCEAFFEHLDYPYDAMHFLFECLRVLAPGGKVTIGIPDTEWPIKSYVKGYTSKYFTISKSKRWHPKHYTTKMEHINYHFRQDGEHKYAYDYELMTKVLKDAGFVKIKKRDFDPKSDKISRYPGILYVEGYKKTK